jgi:hypothetical protein
MTHQDTWRARASLLAAVLLVTPIPARADDSRSAGTDLAGRWTLNRELSDDARAKMREEMETHGGPGGGRPMGPRGGMGGPSGGMGGPGGRGRPPGAGAGGDPREAMRAVLEPAEELSIAQSESEIAVDEQYGRMRRLHPDGRTYKTDNGAAEIKSYWKDGKLLVETKRARGSVLETWERVPDGSRLIVSVRLEGGPGGKLELKRIYDRAAPADESPAR